MGLTRGIAEVLLDQKKRASSPLQFGNTEASSKEGQRTMSSTLAQF